MTKRFDTFGRDPVNPKYPSQRNALDERLKDVCNDAGGNS